MTCPQCSRPLSPDGPSPDFCGESCQQIWATVQRIRRSRVRAYSSDRGVDLRAAYESVAS